MARRSLLKLVRVVAWATLFSAWASPAFAGGYRIVVQAGNEVEQLDRGSVRQIFSGEKFYWEGGGRIVPIHGDLHSGAMDSFFKEVMHQDSQQFLANWRRKLFTGRGTPPHQATSDDHVLELVEKTKGGVGIVSNDAKLPAQVKALRIGD